MNAAQYMKNVGKSMGYIAIDSFKKMSPGIAAIYDNAKDFTSELYDTIDDFKYNITNFDNDKSVASKAKNTATEVWKNARDDFLSGNWYNQERKAAADEEFAKSMGLDLDFDMDDFLNDEGPSNSDSESFDAQSAQETQAVIGTVNGSVSAAANSMVSATVQSTEYLASIQNANTGLMYNLNTKGFKNVNLGLNAINANLSTMLTLAQPLTTHMQNSATFYAKSTELQEKTVSLLEQLVKNTSTVKEELETTRRSLYDYINEGGINIGALFSDAKGDIIKNIKDWKDMFTMLGGGGGDITSSPISALLSGLFPMLLPRSTKKRLKNFNDFIEVAGFNEMNKLSRKYNNSLLGFVGDLLGFSMPSLETKTTIDSGKYEKGKVDWTGKAEKALMEVIPYYLAKMTAVMTGTGEMEVFDYNSGKFTTKSQLQTKFNQERKNVTDYIGWDLYDAIKETSPAAGVTEAQINELSRILIMSGRTDYAKLFSVKKDEREEFIDSVVDAKGKRELREFFKNNPNLYRYLTKAATNTGQNKWGKGKNKQNIIEKTVLGDYANSLGSGFGEMKDFLENLEKSGEYNILNNNSVDISEIVGGKGGGGLFGVDKNNYSALDYLRGIYINTYGGGVGGGVVKSGKISIDDYLPGFAPEPAKAGKSKGKSKAAEATEEEKPKSDKEILDEYITYEYANSKMDDNAVKGLISSLKQDPSIKKYLLAKAKNNEEKDGKFKEDDAIEARIRIKVFGNRISNFAQRHDFDGAIGGFFEKMTNILQYPVDIINRTLDTIKFTIHDIIFSEKGLWGWLFDKEDGKMRPAINAIKNAIFGREVYSGGEEAAVEDNSIIGSALAGGEMNAYNGRIVKKTGLVAVSEGEMIIPAEFNPYYSKPINKAKQIAGETRAIKNFYGAFANGGLAGIGAGGSKGDKNTHREGGLLGVGKNVLEKGFSDFGQLLFQTFKGAVGLGDEEKQEKDKKVTERVIKDAVKGLEEHAGDAIVGGLIGGGVSLLTGSVISPLLGAAVGAGTGLLISSKRVRSFLFGDDEDPEKGLVGGETGKKIRTFIEDQLPTSLVGGALGGVGGALLGHPVLGLFLGSGIGFATKSAAVQDYLFGAKDANGNRTGISEDGSNALISKELQDRLKKALPGMSVGAIGGIVATAMGGPFGLVGNMLIGSATGAFVTSETFKNWLLGEKDENGKREGGFVKILRERLLDPVKEIFFNVGERLRQDFREVAIGLSGVLKDAVVNFFDKGIGKWIKQGIGGAINGIGKLFGIDNINSKLKDWMTLQPLSDVIQRSNFTRGNLVLDKSGKALTAAQRIDKMGAKVDKSKYGYILADILAGEDREGLADSNLEELQKASKDLLKAKPEDRASIIAGNEYLSRLYSRNSNNLSDKEIRRLQDAVNVEMGRKTPEIIIKDIGNDVKDILDNIKNIWTKGVRINNSPVESSDVEENSVVGSALYDSTNRSDKTTQFRVVDKFGGDKTTGESDASTVAGQIEKAKQEEIEEQNRAFYRDVKEQTQLTDEMVDRLFGSEGPNNDKETKKNGAFGKFFGEDSFIGKAAKMVVKAGEFILTVIPIALAAFATGTFDDLFAVLNVGYGKSDNTDVTDASGNTTSAKNMLQLIYNLPTQNTTALKDYEHYSVTQNDAASLSDRALSTLVRGGGAWVAIFAENIWNGLRLLKTGVPLISEMISEAAMKKFAKEAAEECAEKAAKEAFKGTIKGALRTQVYITAAFALIDFTAGMQDAESILKVSNPSMPQRLLAGGVRAIKNITIIGALFPDSWVVDLFVKCFGEDLGLEKFEAQRKAAEEELAAYNEANGTDYNWDQYQKGVLGNYTWTERSWNAVKEGAINTVAAITNPKQWMQNIKTGTVEGWKSGDTFGGKLFGAIGGFADEALPGLFGDFLSLTDRVWARAADGDIKGVWAENIPAFKDSDPMSQIMSNLIFTLANPVKIIMSPVALLMKVVNDIGYKIGNFVVGITSGGVNYLKNEAAEVQNILHSDDESTSGFTGLASVFKVNEPGDNVKLKPLFKNIALITRIMTVPIEVTKTAGRIVSNVLSPIIDDFKTAVENTSTDVKEVAELALAGRPLEMYSIKSTVSSFNPVVTSITDTVLETSKSILTIPAIAIGAFNIAKGTIYRFIQPYIDKIKNKIEFYKNEFKDAKEKAENGSSIDDIMGDNTLPDLNDPADVFLYASVKVTRFVALPVVALKAAGGYVGGFINRIKVSIKSNNIIYKTALETLKSYVDDDSKTAEDIFNYDPQFDTNDPIWQIRSNILLFPQMFYGMTKLMSTPIQGIKEKLGNAWDNLKKFVNTDYDSSAGGSGFVSQRDARYAGRSLGGYSVGDMGCGPAAASMVLGNSMGANINLARKYQTNGGTDLAYFADAFARNGKSATYYNLAAGASGTDMVRDIASGKPVVLMGRNPYNTSKRYSPFGPNNHYVVARGFKNGGIVIDDPEMGAGGRIYNTNILNSVTAAVGAGASGLRRMTGIGAGSATFNGITDNIWAFFRERGYSEAATAGILANMQAESSFSTGAVGDTDILADGSHGLCQWNRGRWQACIDLAKSMNRDPSDLTVQLLHCHNELTAGAAGKGYANISDPYKAGYEFCVKFEVPQDKEAKGHTRGNLAIDFYNHYTGSNIPFMDNPVLANGSSSNVISASKTNEMTPFQKLLSIPSIIGNAFSSVFSGKNGANNASNSSTVSSGEVLNNDISVASWPGKQPVEYMRDVLGKLTYSKSNRDPEKGGGDCSSTVAWALTKAGIPVTTDSRWQYMNNTDPYTHPSWQNVVWYDGGHRFEERNPGRNVEDLVNLKPNDVIFYSWKNSTSTYPDHVDHVEMYNGNGQLIGNGGGVGTRTRSVHDMQGDIIKIARPKDLWASAGGSGLVSNSFIKGIRQNTVTKGGKVYNINEYRQMKAAGGSAIGEIDKGTALLLKTIITLIETLVKNTNDISSIYEIISAYCSKNIGDKSAQVLSEIAKNRSDDMSSIEDSLAGLKATVDNILAS